MNRQPGRSAGRLAVAAIATGGALGCAIAATGLSGSGVQPASAAERAGAVEVVDPASGAPLTTGHSATAFRLKLPTGAACTGDSPNAGYRIQSFLVPKAVSLDTLSFDSTGPVPAPGEYRSALIDIDSIPFVDQQTAAAVPVGGPGPIIQPLKPFDFVEFTPPFGTFVAPGPYSIGIACTLGAPSITQLDRYWSATLTIVADLADPGPGKISWTVSVAAPSTSTTLAVTPAGTAAQGAEVTLAASVAPAGAAGSITFMDGATSIGVVPLTGGTATLKKRDLAPGPHSFTASFAPSVPDAFAPSASAAATYSVMATGATTTTSSAAATTTSTGSPSTTSGAGIGTGTGGGSGSGTGSVNVATSTGRGAELPRSGGAFVPLVLSALLLLWAGRVAVLLGRRPAAATRKR